MKKISNIAANELKLLFYSPIAWILLVIFFTQCGVAFTSGVTDLIRIKSLGFGLDRVTYRLFTDPNGGILPGIQGYLYLYIPLLCMGLVSRDKASGAYRLLYSSPVTPAQIVLGKFLAVMAYGITMLGVLFVVSLLSAVCVKDMDYGPVISGLLGLYLLLLSYAAIAMFMSSVSRYQIISAVGTIAILFGMNYMTNVGQGIPVIRDIAYWLGIAGRADYFIAGMICSEDVIYFLAVIALFLALTSLRIGFETSSSGKAIRALSYTAAVAVFCIAGYVSSRPKLKFYHDTTRTKYCTLTPVSQDIMKEFDGPMTITTYVNLLGSDMSNGLPKNHTRDIHRFDHYVRFKKDIRMKYVYYYHESESYPLNNAKFKDLDTRGKAEKMASIYHLNLNHYLGPDELGELEDKVGLEEEDYRFFRTVETADGKVAKLRMYEDMERHPGEAEISAALKKLVCDAPVVGVLKGHGERDIFNIGDKGYFTFASSYLSREALVNQGFDVCEVELQDCSDIPEDVSILLVSDPHEDYSAEDLAKIRRYIDRGGNMLIAAKPYWRSKIEPLTDELGISFLPGTLVCENSGFDPDFIMADINPSALKTSSCYVKPIRERKKIVGSGAMALCTGKAAEKGFRVIDIVTTDSLATDSTRVWNELRTNDFRNDAAEFNPEDGEVLMDRAPIVAALSRQTAGREQRIIVMGNADIIGNGELLRARNGVREANYAFILESFRYLSDGIFPVDTSRPANPDTDILWTRDSKGLIKFLFNFLIPLAVAMLGFILIIRRKNR